MTVGELKKLFKDMPDETLVMYHAYDKGCCLGQYRREDTWVFTPKDKYGKLAFVMNPNDDYDPRKPDTLPKPTDRSATNE